MQIKSLILLNASTKLSVTKKLRRLIYTKKRNYTNTLPSGTPSYKHITHHWALALLCVTQLSISIDSINIIQYIFQHLHAHSLLPSPKYSPPPSHNPLPICPHLLQISSLYPHTSPSNLLTTPTHPQPEHIISSNSSLVYTPIPLISP